MSEVKVVKRAGLIDEEGKIIVPFEYDSVTVLRCGIYVAKVSAIKTEDNKILRNQYYHHKKLIPTKDASKFHFYTDKGRVYFSQPILNFVSNSGDSEKIRAIEVPEGWKLVKFDFENNVFIKI